MLKSKNFLLFPLLFSQFLFSQTTIKGYVKDSLNNKSIFNVTVSLQEIKAEIKTDIVGYFALKKIPMGEYTLKIESYGYELFEKKITVGEEKLDLGTINLIYNPSGSQIIPIIIENDLIADETNPQVSVALLQSSKDVFERTAAFELSNYWFRPRGLASDQQVVNFNGVPLREIENRRAKYNNFSGLNDITRNPIESIFGINSAAYSFGAVGGYTEIATNPSQFKKGFKLTYTNANRTYNNRISLTHHSGLNKNGWAYSLSASRTWAKEAKLEGTFYDAWAYYFSLEKKFNENNTVFFTTFGTPISRAGSSANTMEVYNLMGKNYNSLWGWQDGKKRNERVSTIHEPMFMLTHLLKLKNKTSFNNTISYQLGSNSISRLQGYSPEDAATFTNSFSPTYYKNLPSYGLISAEDWISNPALNQINWEELYAKNLVSGVAKYALFRDVKRNNIFSANSQFKSIFSDNLTISGALLYQRNVSNNYKQVADLLGAKYVESKDQFNDYQLYNVNNANTSFYVGDKVEYNYKLTHNLFNFYANANLKHQKWVFNLGLNSTQTSFYREGLFRHYNYEVGNQSMGKSKEMSFFNLGSKLNGLYQIDGNNYLQFNLAQINNAPTTEQIFPTARENNIVNPNPTSLKIFASDISYLLRNSKLNTKATVYYNYFKDDIDINRFYTQGVLGDVLLTEVLTGINKKYLGTELSAEYKPNSTISIFTVASIGQYTYDNNPRLFTYDVNNSYRDLGNAYIKNYKIAGTPQQAYTLGIKYQSPKFWWAGISANYLANNYSNFSYLLRTESFVNSAPFNPSPEEVRSLLKQEEFSGQMAFNLNLGKSFKLGNYYLTLFGAVNNFLNNRNYITSGYEQTRLTDYVAYRDDKTNAKPIFGSKYWFDIGATYYLTLSLRF